MGVVAHMHKGGWICETTRDLVLNIPRSRSMRWSFFVKVRQLAFCRG